MPGRLRNKVALITGAGMGMGRGRRCSSPRTRVVVCDLNGGAAARELVQQAGEALAVVGDVAVGPRTRMSRDGARRFGPSILYNNAGVLLWKDRDRSVLGTASSGTGDGHQSQVGLLGHQVPPQSRGRGSILDRLGLGAGGFTGPRTPRPRAR